jgi:high-affinity Fe2+/Pb2+ permease
MRLVLIGLGVLSTALLGWLVAIGLSVLSGQAEPAATVSLMLVAASVSIVTHVLATLKTWARR